MSSSKTTQEQTEVNFNPATFKHLRKVHMNMTQGAVGQALGVNQSLISHWESGDRQPSEEQLAQICELFDVQASTLAKDHEFVGLTELMKAEFPLIYKRAFELIHDDRIGHATLGKGLLETVYAQFGFATELNKHKDGPPVDERSLQLAYEMHQRMYRPIAEDLERHRTRTTDEPHNDDIEPPPTTGKRPLDPDEDRKRIEKTKPQPVEDEVEVEEPAIEDAIDVADAASPEPDATKQEPSQQPQKPRNANALANLKFDPFGNSYNKPTEPDPKDDEPDDWVAVDTVF